LFTLAACAADASHPVAPSAPRDAASSAEGGEAALGPGVTRTLLAPLAPTGTAVGSAVNAAGVVAGYSFTASSGFGTWHAVRWVNGQIQDLDGGAPRSTLSWTSDINDAGVIVGQFTNAQGQALAASFASTPPRTWPPLPGDATSQAMAVNAAGDLLGKSEDVAFHPRYFTVRGGVQRAFDPQQGFPVEARDLSDGGEVAFNDARGFHQPVAAIATASGGVRWLPAVNASNSGWVMAINNAGQATGFTLGPTGVGFRAVYWTNGQGMALALPPGMTDCEGADINDVGVVAITCSNPLQTNFTGFVWDGHNFRTLGRSRSPPPRTSRSRSSSRSTAGRSWPELPSCRTASPLPCGATRRRRHSTSMATGCSTGATTVRSSPTRPRRTATATGSATLATRTLEPTSRWG
jgi:hypothetical protein